MSMSTWNVLETAPTAKRFTGTEGTTYRLYVELEDDRDRPRAPRYVAMVQPGRGLELKRGRDGVESLEPVQGPDSYARSFGREPGPEWIVNGRPIADYVRVYLDAEDGGEHPGYSDRAHVEFPYGADVTDAARRAVTEWLTETAAAEIFSERNRAEAMHARRTSDLERVRRGVAEARAALDAMIDAERDAQREAARSLVALSAVAE